MMKSKILGVVLAGVMAACFMGACTADVHDNVLNIDEKKVLVESQETALAEFLYGWGFDPVPVPFRNHFVFGGGLHCATLDVRRRGSLRSYL